MPIPATAGSAATLRTAEHETPLFDYFWRRDKRFNLKLLGFSLNIVFFFVFKAGDLLIFVSDGTGYVSVGSGVGLQHFHGFTRN